MILRTVGWDGAPPSAGDVVDLPGDGRAVVVAVAEGAAPGHYRIEVRPARRIVYRPASWATTSAAGA